MCGILGIASTRELGGERQRVRDALHTLSHRGPDDSGAWSARLSNCSISLGHTRLSIIDLTQGGHQPMSSRDGRFLLVYNGEITNYREVRAMLTRTGVPFESSSDTEVLLQAWQVWGVECLNKLEGMFAFAVLDQDLQTLSLCRDAYGIKPLYYSKKNDEFVWASEVQTVQALRSNRAGFDEHIMAQYLLDGRYDLGSSTFLEGIHRLESGHVLHLDLSKKVLHPDLVQWWKPNIHLDSGVSLLDAAQDVRHTFLDSVRMNLQADVPVGIALSGGIDSSAIACAARYLEPDLPLRVFSFVAPGTPKDESKWVSLVSKRIGAQVTEVYITANDLVRDIDDMIACQGEPFGGTSIYAQYRVYGAAREAGVKVILDGQGADEVFAGYHGYPEFRVQSLLDQGREIEALRFLLNWSRFPSHPVRSAVGIALKSFGPEKLRALVDPFRAQPSEEAIGVFKPWIVASLSGDATRPDQPENIAERRLASRLKLALTNGELGSLLRHADRNSMRWSVESRVPFLNRAITRKVLSLPEEYLVSPLGQTKYVLRQALTGIVPEEIIGRRDKVGFETPERALLSAIGSDVIQCWLEGLDSLHAVQAQSARKFVFESLAGERPYTPLAWRLINAARWTQLQA